MSRINVANFRHPDGTDDNITLDSSGRVGIGEASPNRQLVINGGASEGVIQITNNTSGTAVANGFELVHFTNGETQLLNRENGPMVFRVNDATEALRLDTSGNLQFNSGYGSVATAYGCRAWVNFNGTGTIAIRASGNVSSLTDHAAGEYSVSFTNSMPDANYVCHMDSEVEAGNDNRMHSVVFGGRAAGSVRVHVGGTATEDGPDPEAMMVTIFR